MKVLVGSRAAKFWYPEFREPHDTDYFVTTPEENDPRSQDNIEYFYHPGLVPYLETNFQGNVVMPDADELYTIKVSHAFWALQNNTWGKHMSDILFYQSKGCQVIPEFYDVLYNVWVEVHGEKRANLNVPASEFFTQTVERTYDHDSIHASVSYGERPLFEKILRDGSEVAVSREKFQALSYDDQCRLVREEVYATALERILIPSGFMKSPRAAYAWAMRQTITSFSKGWFPYFIVTHYSDLYRPDVDFVARHKENADRLILLEA